MSREAFGLASFSIHSLFLSNFSFVKKHWNQKDLWDTRPDQAWGRICSFQLSAILIIKISRCTLHMSFLLNSFRSFSINLLLFLSKSQGSHNRGWSAKAILTQRGNSENYLGSCILHSRHQNSLWPFLWVPPVWRRPCAFRASAPWPSSLQTGELPPLRTALSKIPSEGGEMNIRWIIPGIRGSLPTFLGRHLAQTSSILVFVLNIASVVSSRSNAREKQDPFQPETLAFPCLRNVTFHGSNNGMPSYMIFHSTSLYRYVSNSYPATCSRESVALLFFPAKTSIPAQ